MEDNLNGRWPQWKTTSMEEYLDGSRPQWKLYRKQMTLACLASQFCTELGPAQPQLVINTVIIWGWGTYWWYWYWLLGPPQGSTSSLCLKVFLSYIIYCTSVGPNSDNLNQTCLCVPLGVFFFRPIFIPTYLCKILWAWDFSLMASNFETKTERFYFCLNT